MKEPYYYELFPDELIKEKEYRDRFVTDAIFNESLLKDLNKECTHRELFQIRHNLYKYGRLDYIYQLIFTIFSETPEKPKYEVIGFDDSNKEIQGILHLLWQYFYGIYYGDFWKLPLLPNPDDYKKSITQEVIEPVKDWLEGVFSNYQVEESPKVLTHNSNMDSKDILEPPEIELYDVADQEDCPKADVVLQRVIQTQLAYGITADNRDKENIKKVIIALMEKDKDRVPLVVDLEMGKGKSLILLEYVKYMCEVNRNFSAIIVKRTIEEATDFVIKLGLQDKSFEQYSLMFEKDLRKYYEGDETNPDNEDSFIGKVVRSFNKKDCILYNISKEFTELVENKEYPYLYCSGCEETNCKVKSCKWNHKKHRIVVITHARLFLSNDNEELLKDIKEWDNGTLKKYRSQLIIDEKIDTFILESIKRKDWIDIKSHLLSLKISDEDKNKIKEVDNYINKLSFPDDSSGITKVETYDKDFKFGDEIYKFLMAISNNRRHIDKLAIIENFLKYGGVLAKDWKTEKAELIQYYNYLNINKYYDEQLNSFIILDATARKDIDYCKSNIKFIEDLSITQNYNVNIFSNTEKQLSKSKLYKNSDYKKGDKESGDYQNYYIKNIELICKDVHEVIKNSKGKTLIVVYKQFLDFVNRVYYFKEDVISKLKENNIEYEYEVIHFGQYTTGVNIFKDFETVIIIGQLDKGTSYYQSKALCLKSDVNKDSEIKLNEQLTDSIQQLGRTALRQGKSINVYTVGIKYELIAELQNYFQANVSKWYLKHFIEFNIANATQQAKPWYKIVKFILEQLQSVDDSIKKNEIWNYVLKEYGVPKETYESALKSPKVKEALISNGIINNPSNIREFIKIRQ